ncbi:rod shape-determining protein MreD [Maribacter sp. TH_r10]|uniref:Rod shape-determining protein MreD n=1 Tax=Maribacter luteus TaxID=2594478 RepID=A0A6I2MJE5_9FLAO|nr:MULTISPECIES: rod shape-determining protein MreD [Maribacter]MDV7138136.1 rod shape-determining protein MreD [Maribacter sp. TH_r10]MRX62700.1 rod shape-determining protein MreD [Maribacter luteus]|tara:strand:- start:1654 stop:2160 length:507 start_codon:yes stop_codon:yes gene_type:complete
MSRGIFINIVRFVLLVLVQVLVFNRLNFFGYINPMVYIMFLYWYPIKENRALFIGLSFLLGISVDLFSDTMAIHTAATTTIAYLRPFIMRFVFGINYEFQSFKLSNTTKAQQFTFLALLILVHHTVFFSLEIFSIANLLLIVKKVLSIGAASLILCLLFSSLFSVNKE